MKRSRQQQRLDLYAGGAYGWTYRTRWHRRILHRLTARFHRHDDRRITR